VEEIWPSDDTDDDTVVSEPTRNTSSQPIWQLLFFLLIPVWGQWDTNHNCYKDDHKHTLKGLKSACEFPGHLFRLQRLPQN